MLRAVVEKLGGQYFVFPEPNPRRVLEIQGAAATNVEKRDRLLAGLTDRTPIGRYEMEYRNSTYQTYKPGVDDNIDLLLGFSVGDATVIELGGGPAYIAQCAKVGICVDLVAHPCLAEHMVGFIEANACHESVVEATLRGMRGCPPHTVVVISWCLDRLPDQRLAIRHFAQLVNQTQGVGLITVCLPAVPRSSISGINYQNGDWVTVGEDPLEDYRLIVEATQAEGLRFTHGGITTNFSSSLDGYSKRDAYVMFFNHG